jgi:hypothetical protein
MKTHDRDGEWEAPRLAGRCVSGKRPRASASPGAELTKGDRMSDNASSVPWLEIIFPLWVFVLSVHILIATFGDPAARGHQ